MLELASQNNTKTEKSNAKYAKNGENCNKLDQKIVGNTGGKRGKFDFLQQN